MSEDRLDQIVFAVTDFANSVEAALVSLRKNLEGLAQFGEYDLEKIKWEDTEGPSGPYQRSEDVNNEHFRALRKDLAEHQGKFRKVGFFIWVFENGTTIGRKKV